MKAIETTPLGKIEMELKNEHIAALRFHAQGEPTKQKEMEPLLKAAFLQLNEYFEKKRTAFDLDFDLSGVTPFQKEVYRELQKLAYGETITYGELARRLGDVKKARAVGTALGKNPIPIFIPCHRIVGATKKAGGYTGGLWIKETLLDLEKTKRNERGSTCHG
ncbi:MAG TPA: methylated-DNA--[protein]-cysteine methyltransferase [Eubacteriaceae bacterium]|nr:methylated-DNA--[protein]-cysteine methyltransferase [Eubacteriaceae bacterium]